MTEGSAPVTSYLPKTVTALDSPIWGRSFSDDEMRAIFCSERYLAACTEVEVALARAQAGLGLIPAEAADGIAAASLQPLDHDRLARETEIVGYPILPIVEQLSATAGEAGKYLHWGATTQDIMDTATVLQIRDGLELVARRVEGVRSALAGLARTHRDTPMAGRTHMQHALPVTFGYKAATWLSGFDRHAERLEQLSPRVLNVQFSGASGTLASLSGRGLETQSALAAELGLGVPSITWHSIRDGIAETVQTLALIGGSLAKIAGDVAIMMTTELSEVAEPFVRHRGASSTMPQKANPISCELILAGARLMRNHASAMLDAMIHDHERATGPWHLEFSAVPEGFATISGMLAQAEFMLEGLRVYPENMGRNLDHSRGLIVAEAVMMALAPHTGRKEAHDIVYAGCRRAVEGSISLYDALKDEVVLTSHLEGEVLKSLTEPRNYLGEAPEMVDRVLAGR
ncbi:3-carboxy-cis,cis-muconate cycloisomerase [Sulfitobacter sp. HI0054]|uniref:class-II fumarase/aspartase family protein n=1 Tax=unclassified Marinovum TaxID=2647166 RepID=UPI0007C3DB30|nr:3-carboxy-cis,cis-muconate cycloisomerase [Sulfitobacter sp. HI0023]KZY25969.1 3-carboxy-cis,cis-muconate cycloisomerase [Sulfitobacter sp. HI0040]KZY50301.1 3-carboxy-cis,cis-muconate cycloisomerase [Sulfitobacter sp. HI0054]KZZ66560.1 3-carboxy-cis,cis-muconate cycloisomerase [Sulfitobacter sp. HI0129]